MHSRRFVVGILSILLVARAVPAPAQTPAADRGSTGEIRGRVTDDSGAPVAGAIIALELELENGLRSSQAISRDDGEFSFLNVAAGPFSLNVSAPGYAPLSRSGVIATAETLLLSPIRLTVVAGTIGVDVTPAPVEVAELQIKQQVQQRVLGVFPNFRVSYSPNPVPLNSRQKFKLSWKAIADPVSFAEVGVTAAIQQSRNDFSQFGSGGDGYAKRFAAVYATELTNTLINNAVLPSLFKQDPRYFYKGTGSASSRVGYAVSRAVVRKGDNGHWQPDYSRIVGHLASGAISNLYYPSQDRHVGLAFQNAAIGLAGAAVGNLMQEFVLKRLTKRGQDGR
jgi:hypothetical protein